MFEITLVVGLPCSGKTTYCNHPKFSHCISFDDPFFHHKNPYGFIDDTCAWTLIQCLQQQRSLIINDPVLCDTPTRHRLIGWLIEHSTTYPDILRYFFENDPEQCIENSKLNPDKKVTEYIKDLSHRYSIPEPLSHSCILLPVYQP
jgi:tRNA uridine 5-carbamoylmethylation protein Kti12